MSSRRLDSFPESLSEGSTVIIASPGSPTENAVGLRILSQEGGPADTALVVTTTESVARTENRYKQLTTDLGGPALRIVDTVSEGQSLSAPYRETPVVFTPSAGDLERLVMALSELSQDPNGSHERRHLLIRSLTPILATASTDRVSRVLDRISGLRTRTGLSLFGLDYTAHDEDTLSALAEHADGILWVSSSTPEEISFEYESTDGRRGSATTETTEN
ncbi:DUF7504 family protein [Halobaculum magnesiiphilum]|uniref:RecA-superfamily ATPase, KaiC/GvpD/RAD55 family n=1 Tax=Halobaculum magnesiiphilum TaxID=1017351 RepID=A0A8T8WI67_9EURY|nr:hypothetical protein [Halobaculum magnesiiphilum]QZP39551.1 hypothetical protein K6T50_18460 [Halobaculum magnesiiphilum]